MPHQLRVFLSDECIDALRARKKADDLTWDEVAANLRVTNNYVHRLISRSRSAGVEVLTRLAEYLNMDMKRCFVRTVEKAPSPSPASHV